MDDLDRNSRRLEPPSDAWPFYAFRALGRRNLPDSITIESRRYELLQTVKHDFYAATGFYRSSDGQRLVLKISRTAPFFFIPLKWLGRHLRNRETRFYRKLHDLPNIPRLIALVGETGFAHEMVSGRPLERGKPVPDGFFAELHALLHELHRRDIAYVDANKSENILIGDDNRPHLIDFQISCDLARFNFFAWRWYLHACQREDIYHILKHQRRMRPDEMSPEMLSKSNRVSWIIRFHRMLARPYFWIRRGIFKRWLFPDKTLPSGSK
jgi:hypothetical protein